MIVISFQKSVSATSDTMLAVIISCFTPAARAASRIRVVPEMADYKEFFWRLENMNSNLGTGTTYVEDDLRGGCIRERKRDMANDINTWDTFSFGNRRLSRRDTYFLQPVRDPRWLCHVMTSITIVVNLSPKES